MTLIFLTFFLKVLANSSKGITRVAISQDTFKTKQGVFKMTNALQVFAYADNMIRTVEGKNGEIFFVAKDIAGMLGYENTRKAVDDHCKKPVAVEDFIRGNESLPLKLQPQTKLIPESDVWRLIIRSNMPEAQKIEDWIMEEVLPTIRKTGGYGVTAEAKELSERVAKMEKELAKAKKIAKKPKLDSVERYITQKIIQKPGYSCSNRFVLNDYMAFCSIHRLTPNPDKLHYRLINVSKGLDAGWYVGIVVKGERL